MNSLSHCSKHTRTHKHRDTHTNRVAWSLVVVSSLTVTLVSGIKVKENWIFFCWGWGLLVTFISTRGLCCVWCVALCSCVFVSERERELVSGHGKWGGTAQWWPPDFSSDRRWGTHVCFCVRFFSQRRIKLLMGLILTERRSDSLQPSVHRGVCVCVHVPCAVSVCLIVSQIIDPVNLNACMLFCVYP